MKEFDQIKLIAHFKRFRKKCFVFSKEEHIQEFMDLLNDENDFVLFGNTIFKKDELLYVEIV